MIHHHRILHKNDACEHFVPFAATLSVQQPQPPHAMIYPLETSARQQDVWFFQDTNHVPCPTQAIPPTLPPCSTTRCL
ncbi:hypothetical protein PAXRUDRAFT_533160 [Paxillus rubicundulus Ve08.2h10]|uniref:Unplaced genomic scaffold scaffold_39, whole genome shotgun sequence n=1 Tax=Paxillus rubicundulus Ve08.2h10 TaxID=930991 RepID=A0A0D0DW44_9AGAM|nr:hypothetical protein PAXRUDRAFT_533160 [Paxillus rubicundulus Ve08.2h10]